MTAKVFAVVAVLFAFGAAYNFTWKEGSLYGMPYRHRMTGLAWLCAFAALASACVAFLVWK